MGSTPFIVISTLGVIYLLTFLLKARATTVITNPMCCLIDPRNTTTLFATVFFDDLANGSKKTACSVSCARQEFLYSGLWMATNCFCSDTLPTRVVEEPSCTRAYVISIVSAISDSVIQFSPLMVTISGDSTVVQEGTSVSLNVASPPGLPARTKHKVYYGDVVAGVEITDSFDNPFQVEFKRTGPVWPTFHITTTYDVPLATGGLAIQVYETISQSDVELTCPDGALDEIPFSCQLKVTGGSHLLVEAKFGTDPTDSFSIATPDPDWLQAEPDRLPSSVMDCQAATFVILGGQGRYSGILKAIEMNAAAITAFELLLLRPKCATGTYSFVSHACVTAEGFDCQFSTDGNVFAQNLQSCVNSNQASCEPARRSLKSNVKTGADNQSYVVVEKEQVIPSKLGWQTMEFSTPWLVREGDRLALALTESKSIKCSKQKPYNSADLTTSTVVSSDKGDVISPGSFTLATLQRQVGAWIRPVREVNVFGHLVSGSENVALTVKVYDKKSDGVTVEKTVPIFETISDTQLEIPVAATGEASLLKLTPHTGQNLEYVWHFGNETEETKTTEPQVEHTYAANGVYPLAVNVSNEYGYRVFKENVTVCTRLVFTGISLQLAEVGVPTDITLELTAGSGYTCLWYLDDVEVHNGVEKVYQHSYTQNGRFAVKVNCSNPLGEIIHTKEQAVQYRLKDLAVRTSGSATGSATKLVFTFSQGSDLYSRLLLNNNLMETSIDYTAKTISSSNLNYAVPIKITYDLTAGNLLLNSSLQGETTFDVPMSGMTILMSPHFTEVNRLFSFTVKFTAGTSIRLMVDYGDGEEHNETVLPLQPWPQDLVLTHKYTSVNTFKITFTASGGSNMETKTLLANVVGPLGTYELVPSESFSAVDTAFSLSLKRVSGDPAVMADITIDWKDFTAVLVEPFKENEMYTHTYKKTGDFRPSITISNSVNSRVVTGLVKVRSAIANFGCRLKENPVEVGALVTVVVMMESPDAVNLTYSLQSGSTTSTVDLTVGAPYDLQHTYTVSGLQKDSAIVCNEVYCKTCNFTVDVRNPVANLVAEFVDLREDPPGELSATLLYTGSAEQFPTRTTYRVDWGDSSSPDTGDLVAGSLPLTVSHKMTVMNYFNATVTVSNGISEFSKTAKVGVFRVINSPSLRVTINQNGAPGYGPTGNCYSAREPLKLKILSDGREDNVAQAQFNFTYTSDPDITTTVSMDTSDLIHRFTKCGEVEIAVTAMNPFSSVSLRKKIEIRTSLRGLSLHLVNAMSLVPKKGGTLAISFDAIADDACICVKKGDYAGSLAFPAIEPSGSTGCSACPTFISVSKRPVNNVLNVELIYPDIIVDNIVVTAKNPENMVTSSLEVTVANLPCPPLVLKLNNETIASPNYPIKILSNEPLLLEASLTGPPCSVKRNVSRQWRLFQVDVDTLDSLSEVNISGYLSSSSLTVRISANVLQPGFYRATIRVVVNSVHSEQPVTMVLNAYADVQYPPLQIQFNDGNPVSKTIGLVEDNICLDPEKYSYDPIVTDSSAPQGITAWKWYCGQPGEAASTNLVSPKPSDFVHPEPRTGCFGDGPGNIDLQTGQLCFASSNLEVNKSYVFRVEGFKPPNRTGSSQLRLETVPGNPPQITARCGIPSLCRNLGSLQSDPLAWAIARTDDQHLIAEVTNQQSGPLTYTWSLRKVLSTGNDEDLSQEKLEEYTLGHKTFTLRIDSTFFNVDLAMLGCMACAQVEGASGSGQTCLRFTFMNPPTIGSCTFNSTGNQGCINCTGFNSILGELAYRFYLKTNSSETVLATSSFPKACVVLPTTGSAVPLCVTATDRVGNSVSKCFTDVEILIPQPEELESILNSVTDKDNTILEELITSADDSTKASVVVSLADAINQLAQKEPASPDASQNDATAKDERRNNRSEAVSNLINVATTILPATPDSLAMATSTVDTVLKNGADVDREGQAYLNDYVNKLCDSLPSIIEGQSTATQIQLANNLLNTALTVLSVSTAQIDDPVPKDMPTSLKEMEYSVDLESEGIESTGPEAVQELSRKNSASEQSRTASSVSRTLVNTLNVRFSVIEPMLVINAEPIQKELSSATVSLSRRTPDQLANYTPPKSDRGSNIRLTGLCGESDMNTSLCSGPVSIQPCYIPPHFPIPDSFQPQQSIITVNNIFAYLSSEQKGITVPEESETVSLSLMSQGKEQIVNEMAEPIEITIAKSRTFKPPPFTGLDPSTNETKLPPVRYAAENIEIYQALLVTLGVVPDDNSGITFQLQPADITACPQYLVFARLINPPVISMTPGGYDFWQMMPKNTAECQNMQTNPNQNGYPYTFFLDNNMLLKARSRAREALGTTKLTEEAYKTIYFGFRQINPSEVNGYSEQNLPTIPYQYRDQINNTALSRVFVSSCLSTEISNPAAWSYKGCLVGSATTTLTTQCFCSHLSTFASGYLAMPNQLDFNYIFANMDFSKNPTLYATEISIAVIFLLVFIWARRKDNQDTKTLGVTPLAENDPDHDYLYEVIISTGRRRGAGTDSKVCFMLSGEYGESEARVLQDPHRKVLQRGNVDRFLLACPRPLGQLIYARIWHNNAGAGDRASWYCNYLGVVDLQTREKFHFLIGRWFAVEEEDGQIDRLIPVSGSDDMMAFAHMFATSLSRDISEDHLWVSVLARPASSRFTRVERVACCLQLLYLSMLTSCMFYRGEGAAKQPNLLTLGPFAISAQEVFVAVINNIITFVPLFLVTYIFRNADLRVSHATKLRETVEEHLDERIDLEKLNEEYQAKAVDLENGPLADMAFIADTPKQKSCPCSWQWRILGWIILILSLAAAVLFTTFYGISFGEAACQKWLSSLFLSFFLSLFITQPVKVILLAIFFSLLCKSTDRVDDLEILAEEDKLIRGLNQRYQLERNEEYLHDEFLRTNFTPRKLVILPPDPEELERARAYRLKQRRANDILREILFFVTFLVILLVVTTSFRDPNSFLLKKSLQNLFFPEEFDKIYTTELFYVWVRQTLIPGLRAKRWYNKEAPIFQRGFLKDRRDRIIGYGLLRQLRVKADSCNVYGPIKPLVKHCHASYSITNQDEYAYGIGWMDFKGDQYSNNSGPEFMYTSSDALEGMPFVGEVTVYSGGGYVHTLRGSEENMLRGIDYLENTNWIDFATRALLIQFTVYNPNINLFAIVTVLVEKPGVGCLLPAYRIETANLFGVMGSDSKYVELGFQIAYILALIGYLIKELRGICKRRCAYFKDYWIYLEWFIILGSFAAIAAYAYMMIASKEAIAEFSRTRGNVFMNFQFLAYWNEMLTYLTAMICFAATMKLVRIFRFSKRVGLLGSVLRYAANDLKYFTIVFSVMFFAFVLVFYLIYTDTLAGFTSILSSVETCMQIILGKFDFTSMYEREMVLGPLLFAVFSLCVVFVMISMFIAILDESFQRVMEDIRLQSDDHEITQFILSQLLHWIGLSSTGWAKKLTGTQESVDEPTFQTENSERDLNRKLTELNKLVDDFMEYVQATQLVDEGQSGHELPAKGTQSTLR